MSDFEAHAALGLEEGGTGIVGGGEGSKSVHACQQLQAAELLERK